MTGGWQVVLWDDDANTEATAAYVLHRVAGLTLAEATDIPARVHRDRTVTVASFAERHEAEVLAARMQVFGLHAGVVAG
jgi:ATP-dependent Clp protease adapter protein ClpS